MLKQLKMAPKKKTSSKKASDKSEDEDYLKKRSRNNEVRKRKHFICIEK